MNKIKLCFENTEKPYPLAKESIYTTWKLWGKNLENPANSLFYP
jgi:hypothetical protein